MSREQTSTSVADRVGNRYLLTRELSAGRAAWHLFDAQKKVGYVFLHTRAEAGFLADLKVIEAVSKRTRLQRWLGRPGHRVEYRNRGLGTLLLRTAMDYARFVGCTVISGEVTQADLLATPWLVAWYQREGFGFSAVHDHPRLAGTVERTL